jgi:polysaccharide export outer membrane protein
MRLLLALALVVSPPAVAQSPDGVAPAVDAYQLGEGDVLTVKVHGETEYGGEVFVESGGQADFPFIGRMVVEGLTTRDVTSLVTTALGADYLVEPKVSVWVEKYGSQEVRVLGAVRNPGVYFLRKPTRITEILAEAGGVLENENVTEIQYRNADGQDVLPVQALLERGEGDALVRRGDVVYVPRGEVVYLSGEVQRPGAVPMEKGLTILQAITKAGGPSKTARLSGAYILREGDRIGVNVRRILNGRDADIQLLPGDQVVIRESMF